MGSPAATRTAVELLRPGGFLSIVGVHTEQAFDVTPAALVSGLITEHGRFEASSEGLAQLHALLAA